MTIGEWAAQLQWYKLVDYAVLAAACLLCITFHELCHGLAALMLGDPTAKRAGRLSLNPLKHIDPMGLVLLVVARFGWAKPVPVNPRYFKNPKAGMAVTALAGPVGNVLLSAVAAAGYTLCAFYSVYLELPWLMTAAEFLSLVFALSAGLAVFNLLPIPPLDGSKVLFSLLPDRIYGKLLRYERYGMLALAALLLTGVLDRPLAFLRVTMINFLSPISTWVLEILNALHF